MITPIYDYSQLLTDENDSLYILVAIGLGPTGCTAAIIMAEAGPKVAAAESKVEVYKLPRAVNLDNKIILAFQAAGHADGLAEWALPAGKLVDHRTEVA